MTKRLRFSLLAVLIFFLIPAGAYSQGITLVDFGSSQASTTFGLAGWTTILKSGNQAYTSLGNDGLIATYDAGEYGDFRGVKGTSRQFSTGERIVVTWYNNSDESFLFTARISFTDDDQPNEVAPDGNWYTMRSFSDYRNTYAEIAPYSTARTVFNITDHGVHKTDATHSLVNINLAIEWGSTYQKQFLVCDKIELLSDADITPPAQPTGLAASVISDSKIQLGWNRPVDNVGVVEYLIYLDGEIEGYSRSESYTCVFLEANTVYEFSVTAWDAAGNESVHSATINASTHSYNGGSALVNPAGFDYRGTIALPENFSWGGEAIAYNRDGDGGQGNQTDGYPGSLFVTNLNQPENGLVGEVRIPTPIISPLKNTGDLNQAATLVQPVNIRPANVNSWSFVDIWRTGLEYVPEQNRLYSSWSIHYTVTGEKHASISTCTATNLSGSTKYGAWYVGSAAQPPIDAMMNDWLFSLPQSWADSHVSGRSLVVGRCRDGGLSGLGPTLYAFSKVGSTPPAANSVLPFTTLLEYGPVEGTDNYNFPNSIDGYKHSDDWRGAMWVCAGDQSAVGVVGNKALGHNWYGYTGERMQHDWVIADVPYPEFYETDPDGKGWRAHNRQPMIIFFDPDDLAAVAGGALHSYDPQPYAALRIPQDIFFGTNHDIFSAAFDAVNSMLFVSEFVRELDGSLLLHLWKVNPVSTSVPLREELPRGYALSQNYPNPFNPTTTIEFVLPERTDVSLRIFTIDGRLLSELYRGNAQAGHHSLAWDAIGIASGIYLIELEAGEFVGMRKCLLLK